MPQTSLLKASSCIFFLRKFSHKVIGANRTAVKAIALNVKVFEVRSVNNSFDEHYSTYKWNSFFFLNNNPARTISTVHIEGTIYLPY